MKRLEQLYIFIVSLIHSIISLTKVLILAKKAHLPKASKKTCVVIGNAPSCIELIPDIPAESTVFMVNNFITMYPEQYAAVKPEAYVLIDPAFWSDSPNLRDAVKITRDKTLSALKLNTNWNLTLFTTTFSLKSGYLQTFFQDSPYITISTCNTIGIEAKTFPKIKHLLFKHNLATPRVQNVLVFSLFVAINMGFEEIKLIGADSSWSRDLRVIDNKTYIADSYFNKNKENETEKMHLCINEAGVVSTVHVYFSSLAILFKSYEDLRDYAKYCKTKIYNCTKNSFIDAFDRKNL